MRRAAPWALAATAGVALALAFPGPGLWPLVLIVPGLLLEAGRRAEGRWGPLLAGWLAGTAHWLIAAHWVLPVVIHYGGLSLPAAIPSIIGAAAILGAFWAAALWVTTRVRPALQPWLLPSLWVLLDALRRLEPFRFPWHPVAVAGADQPWSLASLPVWGASGLSWALLAVGAGGWAILRPDSRRSGVAAVTVALGLVGLFTILAPAALPASGSLTVALIQPGTSLEEKWDPEAWPEVVDRVWRLSREAARQGEADLILWPEGAVPYRLESDSLYLRQVADLAAELGVRIVLNSIAPAGADGAANAAYVVGREGIEGPRYDKMRLVPFGEYVPAWAGLIFPQALVREVGRFTPGRNPVALQAQVPMGMAICYEVVFPGLAVGQVRQGAELLSSLTNDGWYGDSWAPHQHLAHAVLRAVETRRWLVRAALTGVSAAIDPSGRVVGSMEIGRSGVLLAEVAPAIGQTPRVRWGDWWLGVCALLVAACAVAEARGKGRSR